MVLHQKTSLGVCDASHASGQIISVGRLVGQTIGNAFGPPENIIHRCGDLVLGIGLGLDVPCFIIAGGGHIANCIRLRSYPPEKVIDRIEAHAIGVTGLLQWCRIAFN